ncbi:hypothetical protein SDC9_64073 [bioreactor metagenome]|uniref:Uncharacterized protein n=1 Tax=bioreactor metagenome TaxID=1076179 RepID=A0A644XNB2_9ZZZZ
MGRGGRRWSSRTQDLGWSIDDAVQPVAGIPETRDDVAMLVEALVHRGNDQRGGDVEVVNQRPEVLDALRGGEQADAGHVVGAALGQKLDATTQGAAGRQHRIEHEALASGQVVRQPLGVGERLQGLLVANHADEPDLSGGHQPGHAAEHSQTRPQDRHHQRLRVEQRNTRRLGDRRLDSDRPHPNIAGCFVCQQRDQLVDKIAEGRALGVDIAQTGQLVGHQRVIEYLEIHVTYLCTAGRGAARGVQKVTPGLSARGRICHHGGCTRG